MSHVVFINYRRDDSGAEAKLIADALRQTILPEAIFMDTKSINSGDTWPDRIRLALESSKYILVVIGPKWLKAGTNEWGQRRIDNQTDWVRQEISIALNDAKKTIIPLLVSGGQMPPPTALPNDVAAITLRQAIEIRRNYWDHDIKLLKERLSSGVPKNIVHFKPSNPLVESFWDSLSPSLQDAIVLASNAARREGKDIISTRTLFAALRRLQPEPLPNLFAEIPSEALPKALSKGISSDMGALSEIRLFSSCVQDSLNHLTPKSSPTDKLAAEDIFVDIARYGTGSSVRRLRTFGIDAGRINEIVRQLGWTVADRNAV